MSASTSAGATGRPSKTRTLRRRAMVASVSLAMRVLPGIRAPAGGRRAPDLPDHRRRRPVFHERDRDHLPAARLHDLAPDDGLDGPVAALDEDVGAERADQLQRRRRAEDRHEVHAGERREDLGALPRRGERAPRPLEAPHRGVGVDADDERVAEFPRLLEVADVADVQQVEAAVGEDDFLAGALEAADGLGQRVAADDLPAQVRRRQGAGAGRGARAPQRGGAVAQRFAPPASPSRTAVKSSGSISSWCPVIW